MTDIETTSDDDDLRWEMNRRTDEQTDAENNVLKSKLQESNNDKMLEDPADHAGNKVI